MTQTVIVHRTEGHVRRIKPSAAVNVDPEEWLIAPDLSAVGDAPEHHWTVRNDRVVLKNRAAREAADRELRNALREALADRALARNSFNGELCRFLLDELNAIAAEFGDLRQAIASSATLDDLQTAVAQMEDRPQRSMQDLRAALRSRMNRT